MKDYIEQCVKLESTNWKEPNPRVMHGVMGIVTEAIEIMDFRNDQNMLEELGDIMWYVAILCDEFGWTFEDLVAEMDARKSVDPIEKIVICAGHLADLMKKDMFYGRDIPSGHFLPSVAHIIEAVILLADDFDSSLEEIQEMNIVKLNKRYASGKFTSKEAHERT